MGVEREEYSIIDIFFVLLAMFSRSRNIKSNRSKVEKWKNGFMDRILGGALMDEYSCGRVQNLLQWFIEWSTWPDVEVLGLFCFKLLNCDCQEMFISNLKSEAVTVGSFQEIVQRNSLEIRMFYQWYSVWRQAYSRHMKVETHKIHGGRHTQITWR